MLYHSKRADDAELRDKLRELANQRRRFGCEFDVERVAKLIEVAGNIARDDPAYAALS